MENKCYIISEKIRESISIDPFDMNVSNLVIISRIQKGGGLTRIYNKIIDRGDCFSIVTSIFNFRNINKKYNYSYLNLLNTFGLLNRIKYLVNSFKNINSSQVYILNDPSDPLPFISYLIAKDSNTTYTFHHHADHSFCFGMFCDSWNHLDHYPNQYVVCKRFLNNKFDSLLNYI